MFANGVSARKFASTEVDAYAVREVSREQVKGYKVDEKPE